MTSIVDSFYSQERIVAQCAAENFRYLFPAEQAVLEELKRNGLEHMSMLDLGVGAGRTTAHFQPVVRSYIGLDYSAGMLDACHRRFPDGIPNGTFVLGDARDLAAFSPKSFDFVLFSFNGLDSVDTKGRQTALREIRRVLREDGWFAFSTHNIDWRGMHSMSGIRAILAQMKRPAAIVPACIAQWRMRHANGTWSLSRRIDEIREQGCGVFFEGAVRQHYTTHQRQVTALKESGFDRIRAFSGNGIETGASTELNTGYQIYYLARVAPDR